MNFSIHKFVFAIAAACVAQAAELPAPDTGFASTANTSIYQLETTWTNDAGQALRLDALRGHPVVLAMFYTRCRYACPMIVAAMRKIQAALPATERGAARFILVSFDSEHDTPTALHAYREEIGLPEATWILVHGDPDAVRELAMVLGVKYQKLGEDQYAHSNLITVLNSRGEIVYQRTGLEGADSGAVTAVEHAASLGAHSLP